MSIDDIVEPDLNPDLDARGCLGIDPREPVKVILTARPDRVSTQEEANEVLSHPAVTVETYVRANVLHGIRRGGVRPPGKLLVTRDRLTEFKEFCQERGFAVTLESTGELPRSSRPALVAS